MKRDFRFCRKITSPGQDCSGCGTSVASESCSSEKQTRTALPSARPAPAQRPPSALQPTQREPNAVKSLRSLHMYLRATGFMTFCLDIVFSGAGESCIDLAYCLCNGKRQEKKSTKLQIPLPILIFTCLKPRLLNNLGKTFTGWPRAGRPALRPARRSGIPFAKTPRGRRLRSGPRPEDV